MIKNTNIKYAIFSLCLLLTNPYFVLAKECSDILDPEVVDFLKQIFNVFKYLAPVLVLVYSTIDFIKAVASQEKEALKKAAQTALKRVLLAMVLFVLPEVLNYFLELLKLSGTCGVG